MIESIVALIVSALLSMAGVSATADGSFIYMPSLDHKFIVTLSCVDWAGILLQASMYVFVMWVYLAANGRSMRCRTYLILGLIGFVAFFLTNILRMFTELYLLGRVYSSVYQYYLVNWQAFEQQIGLGLMFGTLSILSLLSYPLFKRGVEKSFILRKAKMHL